MWAPTVVAAIFAQLYICHLSNIEMAATVVVTPCCCILLLLCMDTHIDFIHLWATIAAAVSTVALLYLSCTNCCAPVCPTAAVLAININVQSIA